MNIFICQTPFQLFYTKQIIKYLKATTSNQGFLIIHSDLILDYFEKTNNIHFINVKNTLSKKKEFSLIKNAFCIINKYIISGRSIHFYIPHTAGLISNYIYSKALTNKKIRVNLFYEGVLYLYDYKETYKIFHFKRLLISFLLGFIYKYRANILPYNSKIINKIYTPIHTYTKGHNDKKILVEFDKDFEENKGLTNAYLILGGPVEYLKEFYQKSLKSILERKNGNSTIYYKGHSAFNTHNKNKKNVFHNIIKKYNLNYIEIPDNSPIELNIKELNPLIIYSYYSSALLNIRLIFGNKYRIVCYYNHTINNDILVAFKVHNIWLKRIHK